MENRVRKTSYVLLAALVGLVLYIIMHEFGHMLVMLCAGATITEFSILTAHVSSMGGNYSVLTDLWLNANGILLPVFIATIYAFFYKRNKGELYKIFSLLFVIFPLFSLLSSVFIPIMYMQGTAPADDDVTRFLLVFADYFHPLCVSLVAVLLMVGMIILIVKKGILKEYISTMKD